MNSRLGRRSRRYHLERRHRRRHSYNRHLRPHRSLLLNREKNKRLLLVRSQ